MSLVSLVANDHYGPGEGTTQSMNLISCIPWESEVGKGKALVISLLGNFWGHVQFLSYKSALNVHNQCCFHEWWICYFSVSFKEKHYYLETAECKKGKKNISATPFKMSARIEGNMPLGERKCVCVFVNTKGFSWGPKSFLFSIGSTSYGFPREQSRINISIFLRRAEFIASLIK